MSPPNADSDDRRIEAPEPSTPSHGAVDYRAEFYALYRSTHVGPRKGAATAEAHRRRFAKWDLLLGPYLPSSRDAVVVDCGCGNGPIVSWLVQRGYSKAVGIDASQEEVDAARALGLPVERARITEFLAKHTGSIDFVILRNVLEHHYKHEIVEILKRTREAMTEGGRVFIQVPNSETPFGARLRYADFSHEVAFTSSSISQVLRVCGFDEIETGPIRTGARGWRRLVWRATELLYKSLLRAELGNQEFIVTQDLFAVGCCAR